MNNRFLLGVIVCVFSIFWIHAFDIDADIEIVSNDNEYSVKAVNNEGFDVFLVLNFPKLIGLVSEGDLPVVIPISSGEHDAVYTLTKIADAKKIGYGVQYSFLYGNPLDVQQDNVLYFFPFAHGVRHRVTQGWNGAFSHKGQNQYSIDFDLEEGEEIYAARDGLVVAVKADSNRGGTGSAYQKYTNYILIKHKDNTFGNYAHLQQNGVLVEVGQEVVAGDVIGLSGNTGQSSGPHLHFDVRVPTMSGVMQSVPFYFRDREGERVELKSGWSYYGFFPGGPDFEEINGEDIKRDDYVDFFAALDNDFPRDILKLRQEVIDNVVLLFIANGFEKPVKAEIHLTLTNLLLDDALPLSVDIPSRGEVFLSLLNVRNLEKQIAVRSRMKYRFIENETAR